MLTIYSKLESLQDVGRGIDGAFVGVLKDTEKSMSKVVCEHLSTLVVLEVPLIISTKSHWPRKLKILSSVP